MSNQQTEITKSFVLRLDFDAETELDKIVAQLGNNQTQAVRYVIKNFRSQERQLAAYKMELAKVQRQLASVKEDLRTYFEVRANLEKFIEWYQLREQASFSFAQNDTKILRSQVWWVKERERKGKIVVSK